MDVIAGPTGGAWTNLIYAQKGTKALCWMTSQYGDFPCFSSLAIYSGVEMRYLPVIEETSGLGQGSYYEVNLAELNKAIKGLDL